MEEAQAERAFDHLVAWGLIEERDGDVQGTRRWNAKLQAAAEKINLLAARDDVAIEGNPLVLAVREALANENLTRDEALFADCVAMLVTLELARMTPEKRAQYGFGGFAPS